MIASIRAMVSLQAVHHLVILDMVVIIEKTRYFGSGSTQVICYSFGALAHYL